MHIFHFYHGHRIGRLAFSDFWLYELSVWLHTLSQSLVGIFVPVLMLKSGYGVTDVVIYYLLFNIIDVPLNYVARSAVRRYGARIVIAIGTFSTILFFWLFFYLSLASWPLLVALAALGAAYDAFYWVAHFYLFMESGGSVREAGRDTGIIYGVRQVALMLGPMLGAAILIFASQKVLIYVTIAGFVLSLVPLIKLNDFSDKPHAPSLPFKEFFAPEGGRRAFLSTAFYAIHDSVENSLFPVFIFLIFTTIESVALIPVILTITSIGIALFLGNMRARRRELAIAFGALAIAAIWLVRIFEGGTTVYYASILFVGIAAYFVMVPIDTIIFEHGRKVNDPLSASMYRNASYMGTNILLYAALALLLRVFDASFAFAVVSLLALVAINLMPFVRMREHARSA